MKKILQKNEKILRLEARDVRLADIKTKKIQTVLKEMSAALKSQDDGVAIAAPQIGVSLRIFVIAGKIFAKDFGKKREDELKAGLPERGLSQGDGPRVSAARALADSDLGRGGPAFRDLIFINPKILKLSKEKEWVPEGCLSVRWLYGNTFRSKKATILAYDEKGKKFQRGASGLLAQIFQHETEHLNGILFTDHAKDIKEELPRPNLS